MSFAIRVDGVAHAAVDAALPALVADLVASGITAQDPTLWGPAAEDAAASRLGWVDAVSVSRPLVAEVAALRAELALTGITRIVLAGIGGASLAAEVIARTAGVPLTIVDTTAPGQVLAALDGDETGDLAHSVLVVASASGVTVETDAVRRTFEAAFRDMGVDPAGRVIVVTTPGSPLDDDAGASGYRVFHTDPTASGRFGALSALALVPAGLAGADLDELLDEADATLLEVAIDSVDNPALVLASAVAGLDPRRDKLALVADGTHTDQLPEWIEQLLAESTGKDGTGVLPVVLLPVSPELERRPDDLQVLRLVDDAEHRHMFARHPDEILISGSLGAQFVVWEYAAVVIARMLHVNPFDQPDVEAAKSAARLLLERRPPRPAPAFITPEGVEVRVSDPDLAATGTLAGVLDALWSRLPDDGYISVQAYADRTGVPELAGLRELIAADARRPTTFGWGPRCLHSTDQIHRGGPATGVFLQILEHTAVDVQIPGRPFTFAELIAAQAAGSAGRLAERGRPVVTLTLTDPQQDVLTLFEAAQ